MIRVMIVDDHPALRAGLLTVLRREPGLVPCATASTAAETIDQMDVAPDVVLVDYQLPEDHGLQLCRQIKRKEATVRVLIYSAHAGDALAIPARLAEADGIVDKATPADTLFEAIRTVARGGSVFPPPRRDLVEAAQETLEAVDLPIIGMMQEGTPLSEVAEVLQIDRDELDQRIAKLIEALRPPIVRPM